MAFKSRSGRSWVLLFHLEFHVDGSVVLLGRSCGALGRSWAPLGDFWEKVLKKDPQMNSDVFPSNPKLKLLFKSAIYDPNLEVTLPVKVCVKFLISMLSVVIVGFILLVESSNIIIPLLSIGLPDESFVTFVTISNVVSSTFEICVTLVVATVGVEGVTTADALKSAIAAVNVTVVSADGYNVNSSKLITIITLP